MPELTAAQVKAAAGYIPLSRRIQFRTTEAFAERVEQAADDCGMAVADWCRSILEMAVEAHEQREAMILAGIDPDTLTIEEQAAVDESMLTQAPDAVIEEAADYAARVRAAARDVRLDEDPPVAVTEVVNPRDCPHLPVDRHGRVCGRCGLTVVRSTMPSSAGGRYVGGR